MKAGRGQWLEGGRDGREREGDGWGREGDMGE